MQIRAKPRPKGFDGRRSSSAARSSSWSRRRFLATGGVGRYIARHGEGFHHISISVENLPEAVQYFELHGIGVLAANYDNPHWRHCYLNPKDTCGALIQVFEENEKTLGDAGG